jgi:hypothetical protein
MGSSSVWVFLAHVHAIIANGNFPPGVRLQLEYDDLSHIVFQPNQLIAADAVEEGPVDNKLRAVRPISKEETL